MKTTDVTIRRTRFGTNVVNDVKRRNVKPFTINDFLGDELTATEKTTVLRIHTDVTTLLINIKKDAFHIGQLLSNAKEILSHGMFTPWIRSFFGNNLPYSTANFYMRIYEVFRENPELVKYTPTKYMHMLTNKNFPVKVLQHIKENADKFGDVSLKQVKEFYKLFHEGKIGSNQFLQLAKEQIKVGIDVERKSHRHRINTITRMSFERGADDIFSRIKELIDTAFQMEGVYPPNLTSKGHRELIKNVDKIIESLQKFKSAVEGRDGMFRTESMENGDKVTSNL